MSFWHRPLPAMTDAFTAVGFRIAVISEPGPAPAARELFPEQIAAKPRFLFFVLHASYPCPPANPPAGGFFGPGQPVLRGLA